MLTSNITTSSTGRLKAKVEIYYGSTLVRTCTCNDVLKEFTVSREGNNSKFFGFGICHKIKAMFIDLDRELEITSQHHFKVAYGDGITFDYPYPIFYVDEVTRDEEDNTLTVVACDKLYTASRSQISELHMTTPYTIRQCATYCANWLGLTLVIQHPEFTDDTFTLRFSSGANVSGDENIRAFLDDIAEATQTIYYIQNANELVFTPLITTGEAYTAPRRDYYAYKSGEAKTLTAICHTTELDDNVSSYKVGDDNGVVQYVRDNAFWTASSYVYDLVDDAIDRVGNSRIYEVSCEWAGNYLLQPADKIAFINEDGSTIETYVLNETITYDGVLTELTEWEYTENDVETETNPSSLGEIINQTYAKVDKVNKRIELVVSESNDIKDQLAELTITSDSIVTEVTSVNDRVNDLSNANDATNNSLSDLEDKVNSNKEDINDKLTILEETVSTKQDKDSFDIDVKKVLSDGVNEIKTETNYSFDDTGLHIGYSESEVSTVITNNGMTVSSNNQELLVANSDGVDAQNLKATTWLIIGNNSRFEDYGSNRTACYWIGG